jgi:aspartate aminotransferase
VRIDDVGSSPILALFAEVNERRRRGERILGLHVGEPDFETPAGIRDAATRAMAEGLTHYAPAAGLPELREGIARDLARRHGLTTSPDRVVVLPAKYAIYATFLSTVQEGDEVLLPDPTYLFEGPVRLTGARPVRFPLRSDFSLDLDALDEAITPRTKLLVLVTPGNPTGRSIRRSEAKAVAEIAKDHGITVVSDETYESILFEGTHVALASVAPPEVPVVTIGSFSKTYSMTGWRAGYVVAPPDLVERLVRVMENTLSCIPPFIQAACLWALENAGADVVRFREAFRERRDHLLARLDDLPGVACQRPDGTFYLFPRIHLEMTSLELSRRLLQEERLALVPGVTFGPRGEGHLRISCSAPVSALEDAAQRLGRFLERHGASRG